MGRTPLFRLLQRAAAIARASRHVRMPLDEFVDAWCACQRFDRRRRRRLLQGAGASALLSGCSSVPERRCALGRMTKSSSSVPASPG
jgi:monoamine oxidase